MTLTKKQKGLYLALGTAVISGFSVFFNSFAAKSASNPYILTTTKNIIVALLLGCLILTPLIRTKLKTLTKHDWLKLILIGLIGGSIPFLLFFKGLSMSNAVNAGFIHKTLFIWVTILAIPLLKEKLSKIQLTAAIMLFVGNFFLIGINSWSFGKADLLILLATLFWSAEFVFAKKLLQQIDAKILAWARMFFGSFFMIIFIFATNQGAQFFSLNTASWSWIILTAIFLFAYVLTWYNALKKLPASIVASILVIASPITTLLKNIFISNTYSAHQVIGSLIILSAIIGISIFFYKFKKHETGKQTI